jgi:hypothetical protein
MPGATIQGVARDLGINGHMLRRGRKLLEEHREKAFPGPGHPAARQADSDVMVRDMWQYRKVKQDFIEVFSVDNQGITYLNDAWVFRDVTAKDLNSGDENGPVEITRDMLTSRIEFRDVDHVFLNVDRKRNNRIRLKSVIFELRDGAQMDIDFPTGMRMQFQGNRVGFFAPMKDEDASRFVEALSRLLEMASTRDRAKR